MLHICMYSMCACTQGTLYWVLFVLRRHLHIPLYCAERAWGYAMELKQVEGGRHFPPSATTCCSASPRPPSAPMPSSPSAPRGPTRKTALEAEVRHGCTWGISDALGRCHAEALQ